MDEKILQKLTEEQKEKLKACKSPEDLKKLIQEESIQLSPEELAAAGGGCCFPQTCEECTH